MLPCFFRSFFHCSCAHRDLHSFPTRALPISIGGRINVTVDATSTAATLVFDVTFGGTMANIKMPLIQTTFTDRKSTRLNSSHTVISYAVFCLKKKKNKRNEHQPPKHNKK